MSYDTMAMKLWEEKARQSAQRVKKETQYERHLLNCNLPCEP